MLLICLLSSSKLFSQIYNWYTLPNAPDGGRYEDLHFINANTGWLVHLNGIIYKTSDGGESWAYMDSVFQGSFRSVYFLNENTGWVGSLNTNFILFKTTNGGIDLTPVSNIPDPKPKGICGLHGIGNDFIYGCGTYQDSATFIKSTDGGNTWITERLTQYTTSITDSYFFNKDTGIAVGGLGSFTSRRSTMLYTTDGGFNWTVNYLGSRNGEWGWKISFTDDQNGFVSLERLNGPKFFVKTSNGGLNWTELPFENFNEQGIGFINPNTGWIGGGNQTTYGTTNGGLNWFNANIGMEINRFCMFGDTLGYACGLTVYKYSKSVGITQLSTNVPENYSLGQNFPNPFNPVTKIKFDIPRDARSETQDVKLVIFDVLGKEVMTLINETLSPGSYETDFDGSNFVSGIYFYKLAAGDFIETKRMILIK